MKILNQIAWVFIIIGLAGCTGGGFNASSVNSSNGSRVGTPVSTGPQGTMVQQSDISCDHVFRSPYVGTGTASTWLPMAFYYVNGARWIMQVTGDGHLVDFPEPAGVTVPCDTPLEDIPQAPYGHDYGLISGVDNADHMVPALTSNAMFAGLHIDSVTNRAVVSVVGIYTTPFLDNNFFEFEFDPTTSTKTLKSCWGLAGVPVTVTGGGMVDIPDYFTTNFLTAGVRRLVGNGGPNGGVPAGISLGMVGYANAAPPDNSCAPATNYLSPPGRALVNHPPNESGHNPTCSGVDIGCRVTGAASIPYPQRTANTNYSVDVYNETWDPIDGYGYIGAISGGASYDWYKSPTKESLISVYAQVSGWINTTVAPMPAPTYNGATNSGTMTLINAYAHDGDLSTSHPNPGDILWVETCVVGRDAGCASVNLNNTSCAVVDSFNSATNFVTFHYGAPCLTDPSSGPHVPLVPGQVRLGCLYAHGEPGCSRMNSGLQLINPAQFAQVAQGTRDPSSVTYDVDFPLGPYMPQFGCTTCGFGASVYTGVGTPMADGAHNQFLVPVNSPVPGVYASSKVIFVFNVKP